MIPKVPHPFIEFQGSTVTIDTGDTTLAAHVNHRVNYISPAGAVGYWEAVVVATKKVRATPPPEELISGVWVVWATSQTSEGVPRISHSGRFYVDKVGTAAR